jgi:hypothetical protein
MQGDFIHREAMTSTDKLVIRMLLACAWGSEVCWNRISDQFDTHVAKISLAGPAFDVIISRFLQVSLSTSRTCSQLQWSTTIVLFHELIDSQSSHRDRSTFQHCSASVGNLISTLSRATVLKVPIPIYLHSCRVILTKNMILCYN